MNLRSLFLGTALVLGATAFAQPLPPYSVNVAGLVLGCTPGSSVNILTVQNTQPALDIDVPLDANCGFSVDLSMDSFQGWFVISTPCNGAIQTATLNYQINTVDSTFLFVVFDCANSVNDCLGILGGPNLPGTSCTTALGQAGTWSAECLCVANSTNCNACFTVEQASTPGGGDIPFTADFTNCSTGGTAPYTYSWGTPDSSVVTTSDLTYTFPGEGIYTICLFVADANGCTSLFCDSVVVDANGGINTNSTFFDCLQIPNGPNLPGTPCTVAGTNLGGTWSADCICVPDSNSTVCQAGFWAIQAYTWVDSTGNPNGGGVEPIPNEVWVWNLSSGGDGNYQFVWDFGDGTTSTDPYPTHIYGASGPYLLCLTMTDGSGCTSTFCDSISVDENGLIGGMAPENGNRSGFTLNVLSELPTAVAGRNALDEVALWPNPASDAITLSIATTLSGRIELSVVDLNGRVVASTSNAVNAGNNRITVPVSELQTGMYLLRITNGSSTASRRFVKN